jgi:hypothetical protein
VAGGDAGGIASAVRLLEKYGGAIEADLQRYYGLHIGDFPWPLTARRLRVLVENLPSGSQFHLALTPEDERAWSIDTYMFANVIDELRINRWQAALIAGAKGVKPPQPFPRPSADRAAVRDPRHVARVLNHHGKKPRRIGGDKHG